VQKAEAQHLHRQFENIRFTDGEGMDDFTLRLQNIITALETVGETIELQRVVEKLLRVVPKSLRQVAIAIQVTADLTTLTLEDASGRLRAAQECKAEDDTLPPPHADGKLYLTREQWEEQSRDKQRDVGGSGSKSGNRRGRPRRAPSGGGSHSRSEHKLGIDQWKCLKTGHWARECPSGPKKAEAHVAQVEEEEGPALFFASASINAEAAALPTVVHLVEEKVLAQLDGDDGGEHDTGLWYLDTGATNHMTGAREAFTELNTRVQGTVKFGDGSVVAIEGRGSILFEAKTGEHQRLFNVYYILQLTANIVSLGQLDEGGCKVHIDDGVLRIWDERRRLVARVQRSTARLYLLKLKLAKLVCLVAQRSDEAWRWHERFGHLHFDALRKLAKDDMVCGLPDIEHIKQLCDCCVATKQRRVSFPAVAKYRAQGLLDLVHGDLCGPITPAMPGGRRHFLLLVDDHSRYMWVRLLRSKDEAPVAIEQWQALVDAETGRVLRVLRTDNGGEFTSVEFGEWCAGRGVRRHLAAPYSPQQNGVVERRNQTVVAMAQSLLKERQMPAMFWGEVVVTAVYLLNRVPTKSLARRTPYEAWHGVKPAVHHLRIFGCVVHVKTVKPHLRKLEDQSTKMVLLGYEKGTKAYRVFDPTAQRVHDSRDVVFDEST
jgi:transposase InsO family protein